MDSVRCRRGLKDGGMGILLRTLLASLAGSQPPGSAGGAEPAGTADQENQCILCHANAELWEKDTLRLYRAAGRFGGRHPLAEGRPLPGVPRRRSDDDQPARRPRGGRGDGLRVIAKPDDVPGFCGHCHSDAKYMQRFQKVPKTDQERSSGTASTESTSRRSAPTRRPPTRRPPTRQPADKAARRAAAGGDEPAVASRKRLASQRGGRRRAEQGGRRRQDARGGHLHLLPPQARHAGGLRPALQHAPEAPVRDLRQLPQRAAHRSPQERAPRRRATQ